MSSRPLEIVGVGRYLPVRVVTNADVEARMGLRAGVLDRTMAGVSERHWVDGEKETASFMAAQAANEALADAGLAARDLDLVLNASGTQEQAIPDGGPLIQRQLGADGVPCFSVHATCLSFPVALDVAASFLATDRYRTILVVSSDISSCGIDPKDRSTFPLFGDAAAAVVVTRTPEGEPSALERFVARTYSEGADHTHVRGGGTRWHPNAPHTRPEDNTFKMDARSVVELALRHGTEVLEELRPGLSKDLGDIAMVVPHQASGVALEALRSFGWDPARIARTLDRLGNCVAASMPATLYEVVKDGRIKRGDRVLLLGTGAGLSIVAALLRY